MARAFISDRTNDATAEELVQAISGVELIKDKKIEYWLCRQNYQGVRGSIVMICAKPRASTQVKWQ